MDLDSSTQTLLWIERGKTAGAFLVVIGVAMEFLGDWNGGAIQKQIDRPTAIGREATLAPNSFLNSVENSDKWPRR